MRCVSHSHLYIIEENDEQTCVNQAGGRISNIKRFKCQNDSILLLCILNFL